MFFNKIFFRTSFPDFEEYCFNNDELIIKEKFISKIKNKTKRVHSYFSSNSDDDDKFLNFLLNATNDILITNYLNRIDL